MKATLRCSMMLLLASLAMAQTPSRYSELYRPQYHFSPPQNFMNDANGMVFFQGEYHLFYQHNPLGNIWGHMSWGHAVSSDMVHWQNLPVAIPEAKDYMIFSGSAVVDEHNASGLCGIQPCLIAMYTAHKEGWQRQNLAFSLDRGRTWKDYPGNPVVDEKKPDHRDPKVFWYEPEKKWVLVTVFADERQAVFYESKDLKKWKRLSIFGPAGTTEGQWECPDLVELPVEGTDQKKWVLIISRNPGAPQGGTGVQYFVGHFDGKTFTNETPDAQKLWVDYGKDFYATQRFADLPADDHRVIWMGWLGNWKYANQEPTSPWRGVQSIPREMFLRKCDTGYCLGQHPVRELESLRAGGLTAVFEAMKKSKMWVAQRPAIEFEAEISTDREARLVITDIGNKSVSIGFDPIAKHIYVDRTKSGEVNFNPDFPGRHVAPITSGSSLKLHVFLDGTTLEIFANDGDRVMSERVYLDGSVNLGLQSESPNAKARLQVWRLKSIWSK
jgi:fructan beta-fructosidase